MPCIAANSGAAAFKYFVIAELDDPNKGLNNVDICCLFDHVMGRFVTILQSKTNKNLAKFNKSTNHSRTLAVYTRK